MAEAAQLCTVPVPLHLLNKPFGAPYRPNFTSARTFPGSRWPFFQTSGAPGPLIFVLNEKDQLQLSAELPANLHNFVTEPSGRVVDFRGASNRAQIYIQDPANGIFTGLDGSDGKTIGIVSTVVWISGRGATIATSKGLFSLTSDDPTQHQTP